MAAALLGLEGTFVHWSAEQQLLGKRMINLMTGVPWLVLAACTTPWKLLENAPGIWAVMVVYVLLQSWMIWCQPARYATHYMAWTVSGWAVTAWYFPFMVGTVPLRYLTVEQMQGVWFPLQCGVLTNAVTALYNLVPFRWFLLLYVISLLVNVPNVEAICHVAYEGTLHACRAKAAAISVASLLALGALVYLGELHSRATFLRRLALGGGRAATLAGAAGLGQGDGRPGRGAACPRVAARSRATYLDRLRRRGSAGRAAT